MGAVTPSYVNGRPLQCLMTSTGSRPLVLLSSCSSDWILEFLKLKSVEDIFETPTKKFTPSINMDDVTGCRHVSLVKISCSLLDRLQTSCGLSVFEHTVLCWRYFSLFCSALAAAGTDL